MCNGFAGGHASSIEGPEMNGLRKSVLAMLGHFGIPSLLDMTTVDADSKRIGTTHVTAKQKVSDKDGKINIYFKEQVVK